MAKITTCERERRSIQLSLSSKQSFSTLFQRFYIKSRSKNCKRNSYAVIDKNALFVTFGDLFRTFKKCGNGTRRYKMCAVLGIHNAFLFNDVLLSFFYYFVLLNFCNALVTLINCERLYFMNL